MIDTMMPMTLDRDIFGRIIAERWSDETQTSDAFLSTYTWGVLGLMTRTHENDDTATNNNAEMFYMSDAMGNHVGIIKAGTSTATVQETDAFGVRLGTLQLGGTGTYYRVVYGPYQWRGGEGSETDVFSDRTEDHAETLSTGLVHMGYRYYEPETGRFTQRDPVRFGNPLSLNPYTYAENDPVNQSDPSGTGLWATVGIILVIFALVMFAIEGRYFLKRCTASQQCVIDENYQNENERRRRLGQFAEGLPDALPPGTSCTGPVGAPTTEEEGYLEVLFFLVDLFQGD